MRKLKLLFAALALLIGGVGTANAQETPAHGSAYYIYNADNDLFFTRGADWGTQAYASPVGIPWRVEISDGKYTLKMFDIYTQNNADISLGFNGSYVDNNSPIALTPAGNATDGFTLENGGNYITCPASKGVVTMTSTASKWKFLTQAQYDAIMASRVSAQETAVATSKGITIPGGKTLNEVVSDVNAWASSTTNDALPTKETWPKTGGTQRTNNYNEGTYGIELFESNNASISKTISGLASGIYKVSVRGMRRDGTKESCAAMKTAGFYPRDVYMEANGNIIPVKAWADDNTANNNPDSPTQTVAIINNGGYTSEGFVYVGDDGKLNLTIYTDAFWWGCWFVFNGVSYTYYSNEVSDDDATAILEQATTLQASIKEASVASALANAKSAFESARTIANYNVLSTAVTNAQASVDAYAQAQAYLDEATKILAGTNVYTAAAYATYYTEPKAKIEVGTLTTEEANALVKTSTGWHSANTIDDILLSAWTIGGEQCKDFDKSLYINTWSTEGNTDGSDFLAPFFEYWTNDNKSLGNTNLVATMTGLKANTTYSFTIRARVRQRDQTDEEKTASTDVTKIANGITMKVGAGDAVDISAGAQFGTGKFYIGNFSAVGETDADGKLTTTISVAENSNISWLSFYNAKYTEGEDLSAYIADYEFALNTATTNVTTYTNVTGKEKADLNAAITTYGSVDNTNKAALIAAKEALETANSTFVAAVATYNTFAELNKNVATKLGVALPTITNETVAADLKVEDYIVAEYTAAKAYTKDYTNKLANWTNAPGTNKGESWNGTSTDTYYDLYNNSDIKSMTQTVTLPAGDYALIAKGRASVNGLLTVSDGTNTVTFAHKSSTGRGIATDGTATFADGATYANTNGRGWEYRVLTFTSDGEAATTLTFNWTTASSNWCGLDDIELLCNPVALDYTALETAYNAVTVPTLGFETGEYAPYTNAENLEKIATAKSYINNQDAVSQMAINNLTTAISNLSWTVNAAEMNAVYDGNFTIQTEHTTGPTALNGWNNPEGIRQLIKNTTTYPGLNTASENSAVFAWGNTTMTYGNTEGYTMPLAANTAYELSFKTCGWSDGDMGYVKVTVLNDASEGMAEQTSATATKRITEDNPWNEFKKVFVTGDAGNYKLGMWTSKHTVFTDIVLKKAAPESVTVTAAGYATYVSDQPLDFTSTEIKAYTAKVNAGKVVLTQINKVPANTPVVLYKEGGATESIPVATTTDTPAASDLVAGTGAAVATDGGTGYTNYILNNVSGIGFYWAAGQTVAKNRAYLHVADADKAAAPALTIVFDGDATGIKGIYDSNIYDLPIYDLQGRKVAKPTKGLYIVNGRKVMVK